MRKNSFIVYTDYLEPLESLSMEQRGVLFTALMKFQKGDDIPQMDAQTKMAFLFISNDMKINNEKYEEISRERSEAGKRGAEQKKANKASVDYATNNETNKANADFAIHKEANETNEADNDKDNINDNVKDNEEKREDDNVQVWEMYNTYCPSLRPSYEFTEERNEAVKELRKTFSLDKLKEAFRKAEASSFIKGDNERRWKGSFDWIVKPDNITKILEGNYDNGTSENIYNRGLLEWVTGESKV